VLSSVFGTSPRIIPGSSSLIEVSLLGLGTQTYSTLNRLHLCTSFSVFPLRRAVCIGWLFNSCSLLIQQPQIQHRLPQDDKCTPGHHQCDPTNNAFLRICNAQGEWQVSAYCGRRKGGDGWYVHDTRNACSSRRLATETDEIIAAEDQVMADRALTTNATVVLSSPISSPFRRKNLLTRRPTLSKLLSLASQSVHLGQILISMPPRISNKST
jgi:hypothetical protein